MSFPPALLGDLANVGANIVIDALTAPPAEVGQIVRQWERSNGHVTIKNASRIPPADLLGMARALGVRITLEE